MCRKLGGPAEIRLNRQSMIHIRLSRQSFSTPAGHKNPQEPLSRSIQERIILGPVRSGLYAG